jgi:short-subunit dehydrogenase
MVAGNRVLITGASTGIGRACVELLSRDGFHVAAIVRRLSDAESLKRDFPDLSTFLLDLSDQKAIEKFPDEYGALFGDADILINNAGYGIRGAVEEWESPDVQKIFSVNVFAPLQLARQAIPGMRSRGGGLIINISSVTGMLASPFNGVYAATKHAMEGWTDALRMEVAPFGIKVVLVQPGPVRTNFMKNSESNSEKVLSKPDSSYAPFYRRAVSQVSRLHESAVAAESAANLIARIIKDEHPRSRYRLHFVSRVAPYMLALLPRKILDFLLKKNAGLS